MPKKIFKFQVSIKNQVNSVLLSVVQNDIDGNQFDISLTDNGKPFDLTGASGVTFTALKEDNTISVGYATIVDYEGGKISYLLTDQCVALPGTVRVSVEVYEGLSRITSAGFTYEVRNDLAIGADASSSSEYPMLLSLMEDIGAIQTLEAARAIAEDGRVTVEGTRVTAEGVRVDSEDDRVVAESARVVAESSRVTVEGNRVIADSSRQSEHNAFKVYEAYDPSKIYVPLNKVTYLGSSYQAKEQSQGDVPSANPLKWLLIASKGDTGLTGAKGDQGIQGLQGVQGIPGLNGEGAGDMLALTYDTDGDGIVNHAEVADLLGDKAAGDFSLAGHGHDTTYLGITATATDSSKLGGVVASEYMTNSAVSTTVEDIAPLMSLPSTAKDGVLQGILKGRTVQNLVKNGRFTTDSNADGLADDWTFNGTIRSLVGGVQKFTPIAQYTSVGQNLSLAKGGDKVYARATYKSSTGDVWLYVNDGVDQSGVFHSGNGSFEIKSVIRTIAATPLSLRVILQDNKSSGWTQIEVDEIFSINLTAMFGAGNEPDIATCDKIFNYVDGLRSVEDVRVKSVGKNLVKNGSGEEGIDKWKSDVITSVLSVTTNKFQLLTTIGYGYVAQKIKVKANTDYHLKGNITGNSNLFVFDETLNTTIKTGVGSFNTGVNTTVMVLIRNNTAGTGTADSIQLGEDAILAYEPYEGTEAYINASLRKLPNGVFDEVTLAGEKIQRTKEYLLQSADIEAYYTSFPNNDLILLKTNLGLGQLPWIAGLDGNILVNGWNETGTYSGYGASENGGFYADPDGRINFIVAKGTYATLEAAQTALAGTKIIYQLAVPIVSKIEGIETILSRPSGTIYLEPFYKFVSTPVVGVITIPNTALTIKAIESLRKVKTLDDGSKEYSPAVVTSFTTTTITITSPDNTAMYEVVYEYDNALSTIPTLSYTFATNLAAVLDGNTKAIADLSKEVANISGIVESGSNANGYYVKFADGTMICRHRISVAAVANTLAYVDWVYPSTFAIVTNTNCIANIVSVNNTNDYVLLLLTLGINWSNVQVRNIIIKVSVSQTYTIDLIAIGRWK